MLDTECDKCELMEMAGNLLLHKGDGRNFNVR